MGVPKFYRWLSERYPLVNQKVGKDTQFLPKFDNMYLDMNGIIHTCTHPNDEDVTNKISMKDMVLGMFSYVDRMVHIVKPQKVLVLAVDGCAPRAKMNQQRSRRFASAKERREGLEKALKEGKMTEEEIREQFDSNCITPGTEFMEQVSRQFQYFIRLKIKEDPLWRKLKVIYSGHDVPGEGEHKIMDYIRHTRMQPGYDPNTRHCLCGLDADLIMLGLASHEPHFSLLREEVDFTGGRGGKKGGSQTTKEVKKQVEQDKWELLHLSALRQYLDLEFRTDSIPFGYNLERIIDDWVLLVMLVGNDFLPHLPSLSIAEGGLDDLMSQYKTCLPKLGGYITEGGKVHFDRLEVMLGTIASNEKEVFEKRVVAMNKERKRNERFAAKLAAQEAETGESDVDGNDAKETFEGPYAEMARERGLVNSRSTFKEKYYAEKFGIGLDDREVIDKIVLSYIEGIQWCYLYYYQGVQSWTWFFPFHYAPLASDMKNLSRFKISLKKGKPFLPFMQLLSCLPSDSAKFLPACYRELMTLSTSPLAEFYPRDFKVDMNGKRNSWEGVNLLPFIDERLLIQAVEQHCPTEKLTPEERDRNNFGHELIFELDTSNTSTVPSSFPAAGLPDIELCQSSVKRFLLPPMDHFVPDLLPGAVADGRWPGDPQLIPALQLQAGNPACLMPAGVCVFNRETTRDSLILNVVPSNLQELGQDAIQAATEATHLAENEDSAAAPLVAALQKYQNTLKRRLTVFVDFPNLREAEVVAVADDSYIYPLVEQKKKSFAFLRDVQTEIDTERFFNDAEFAETVALRGARKVGTGGVRIGEVEVMLKVRPLIGMDVDISSGSAKQIYSDTETWVPSQLVCFVNQARDPRFEPRMPKTITDRFPLNCKILCLQKAGYGLVGTVVGVEKNFLKAEFKEMSPQIPPFGHTIANSIFDQYISSHKAARHFGIDPSTLGKISGSVLVRPGNFDIGLNLKVGRGYVIPGYVRSRSTESNKPAWSTGESVTVISGLDPIERAKAGNDLSNQSAGWEYTSRALELIATYRKKFPQVFAALEKKPKGIEYDVAEMFGPGPEGKKVLDDVCKWLEQIDTFRLPLVPTTSKSMSRDAILAVQRASDDVRKKVLEAQKNSTVVISISPDVVYKYSSDMESEWIKSPSANIPPRLGDRVANMGSPVVPFGLGGTVVATHASTGCVEVLFDTEFIGGTSLYGACGNNRGKLLPWSQLLNLSKRVYLQPRGKSATNKAPTPAKQAETKTQSSTGKQTSAQPVAQKGDRKQRKEAANSRGKNPNVKPPSAEPPTSKFVVPAAPESANENASYNAATESFVPVPEPTEAEKRALNALAGLSVQGEPTTTVAEGTDDLANFWMALQSENKTKRKSRRAKASKDTAASSEQPAPVPTKTNNEKNSKQQAAPTPPPPAKLLTKPAAASPPVPPPQPPPQPSEQQQVSVDPLEDLFQRAAEATGKVYKQQQQQQAPMMPPPPPYGMPYMGMPPPFPFQAPPPPPQFAGYPAQQPPAASQQQQQPK